MRYMQDDYSENYGDCDRVRYGQFSRPPFPRPWNLHHYPSLTIEERQEYAKLFPPLFHLRRTLGLPR